ncbi:MAG: FliM/FliN family flagellar motor switch protein, partial [Planctomycetota bacterium]
FTQTILPFSSVCKVGLDPLKDPFIWALDPTLVLALVDRFLGGTGEVDVEPRTLTTVESGIARRIVETIMECVIGRWMQITALTLKDFSILSNPSRLESVRGMDVVLVIVLRMLGPDQEFGEIMLCIPFGALEDYLEPIGALDAVLNIEGFEQTEWRSRLEKKITQVEIGLPVVLGEAEISVEDVLCLKLDDVIVIDRKISEPLEMPVGTGSVIFGNIGIYNNRLALKITDIRKRNNDAEEVIPSHG